MSTTIRPFLFLAAILLIGLAPTLPAVAGGGAVEIVPELIGNHELAGYFAVGPGCGQSLNESNRDGFKGLLDCYEGEIFLTFDFPVELIVDSLDLTAELIDPDDSDLMSRLPSASTFIPTDFPVLIRIVDDANDGFTFNSQWELEIETRELEFSDRTPLRLFRADEGCPAPGCPFEDATFSSGFGSYHVRGSFGTFSEFVVAADLRPEIAVINAKIANLSQQIDDFVNSGDVDSGIASQLQAELAAAQTAAQQQDYFGAFISLINFIIIVDNNAGNGISVIWDPVEGLVSAAGQLFGGAESAIYSLETAARPKPLSTGGVKTQLFTDGNSLEVTINFDETTDLQADAFYIDAFDIDPFDPGLLSRLPAGVGIDPAFAILLQIGADSSNRPAARGDWQVTIRTRDLDFQQGSNFRLFKAVNLGGAFVDVTDQLGVGSLLARGSVAEFDQFSFSEYLLVRDTRTPSTVVSLKFGVLESFLGSLTLDPTLAAQLDTELQAAKTAAINNNLAGAISLLDVFIGTVENNAGLLIPDIWRADDMRSNDAGKLSSRAKSLQFSLSIEKAPLEADPADVNRDGQVDAADVFAAIERVYCSGSCATPPQLPLAPQQ